jgi:hypothetical protein
MIEPFQSIPSTNPHGRRDGRDEGRFALLHHRPGRGATQPGNLAFTLTNTSPVPEPASARLLGVSLMGLMGLVARRGLRGRRVV